LQIDASGNVNIDSNTLYVDATNNRVGLGTSSVNANVRLEVNGNISSNGDSSPGGAGITIGDNQSGGYKWIQSFESHPLVLNPLGNNVGIGTTSPGNALDVRTAGTAARFVATNGNNNQIAFSNAADGAFHFFMGSPAIDVLQFSNSAGTERARIDSSGRLLVGTSSTASAGDSQYARLQVKGNTFLDSGFGIISVLCGTTTPASGSGVGAVLFAGTTGNEFARIDCIADAATGSGDFPGRLTFSTTKDGQSSPTEAMRIDSNQYLLVGATSGWFSRNLVVETAVNDTAVFINSQSGGWPVSVLNTATSGNNLFVGFWTEGRGTPTSRGSIDYNRAAGQVRYNVTSDRRLKSNIQDSDTALSVLEQIKVRSYNWAETGYGVAHGFIAQELSETVPDAVKVGDDGDEVVDAWAVDNAKLVPLLTKALQEALQKIEGLEQRLTDAGIA
jgi:hypothetical protein